MTWQKGQSGNPRGRPKREGTDVTYLQALTKQVGSAHWKKIVQKAVEQAEEGNAAARRILFEYLMGKPIERVHEELAWTPEQMAAALDAPPEAEDE